MRDHAIPITKVIRINNRYLGRGYIRVGQVGEGCVENRSVSFLYWCTYFRFNRVRGARLEYVVRGGRFQRISMFSRNRLEYLFFSSNSCAAHALLGLCIKAKAFTGHFSTKYSDPYAKRIYRVSWKIFKTRTHNAYYLKVEF